MMKRLGSMNSFGDRYEPRAWTTRENNLVTTKVERLPTRVTATDARGAIMDLIRLLSSDALMLDAWTAL